jgi:hypothetical protein
MAGARSATLDLGAEVLTACRQGGFGPDDLVRLSRVSWDDKGDGTGANVWDESSALAAALGIGLRRKWEAVVSRLPSPLRTWVERIVEETGRHYPTLQKKRNEIYLLEDEELKEVTIKEAPDVKRIWPWCVVDDLCGRLPPAYVANAVDLWYALVAELVGAKDS